MGVRPKFPPVTVLHRLATPATFATVTWGLATPELGGRVVIGKAGGALIVIAVMTSVPARGDDDLPIVGTYIKDQSCKGEAARRDDLRVKITGKQIASNMGVCTILHRKRDGKTIAMQVECKVPGDQLILGDVTFTMRDESTLDFDDQDHTSPAVLYRCAEN